MNSGFHSGFGLDKNGESVYLFDTINSGGELIDSIDFAIIDGPLGQEGQEEIIFSQCFLLLELKMVPNYL